MSEKRVVCLNCMDGRAQLPVIHWIKDHSGAAHVDMVTEAGMDGLLANANQNIDAVKTKVNISIEKNAAQAIFVVGHYDCKGNPVSDNEHKSHVQAGVGRMKKEFPDMEVVGLWVNPDWKVEEIS